MTSEEIEKMKKEQETSSKNGFDRWSWFALKERLAKGDITKFKEVENQNFITCLNLLSYWKERDREIKRLEEQQKQKR